MLSPFTVIPELDASPLRPKRAASAGLRCGSGQRKTNHALISEMSTGIPQPENLFHLTL